MTTNKVLEVAREIRQLEVWKPEHGDDTHTATIEEMSAILARHRAPVAASYGAEGLRAALEELAKQADYGVSAIEADLGIRFTTYSTDDGWGMTNDKTSQLARLCAAINAAKRELAQSPTIQADNNKTASIVYTRTNAADVVDFICARVGGCNNGPNGKMLVYPVVAGSPEHALSGDEIVFIASIKQYLIVKAAPPAPIAAQGEK